MQDNKSNLLEHEVRAEIDRWVAKYPPEHKQSAVLSALHLAQDQNGGWISQDLLDAVADYLDMPRIAVYEVATFYTMFDLKPVGKHKIGLCTNISCQLQGSDKIADHLKTCLGVDFGCTTNDGQFTLREVECLGACRNGPVMHLDKTYHENLTPEKIDEILAAVEDQA